MNTNKLENEPNCSLSGVEAHYKLEVLVSFFFVVLSCSQVFLDFSSFCKKKNTNGKAALVFTALRLSQLPHAEKNQGKKKIKGNLWDHMNLLLICRMLHSLVRIIFLI